MWHKILINKQQIEHETSRAALIKCPNKSQFRGCTFWHPLKLVRSQGYAYSFSFTDEFEFKLLKKGEHFDTISASEILDLFGIAHESIDSNLKHIENKQDSFLEVTEPVYVDINSVEVDASLKR